MKLAESVFYVGVNDRELDLFEGQYPVPNGMAYNSYVILDEKIAVMDAVDKHFAAQWLSNVASVLSGRQPDYLVVQHMEPDHSGSIAAFLDAYPNAQVVASKKALQMIDQFFGAACAPNRLAVGEGSTLSLGSHTLQFFTAPMVHWPEVIVTYEQKEKLLFSADAFGKFGALDTQEDWACEARRYYFGIVGKYGVQTQALLKKVTGLDIRKICPLHGPVLEENLGYYLELYDTWSSYRPESAGVLVAYTSVYGNTAQAAALLAKLLQARGCPKVVLTDLARCDMTEAVEDAFRYSHMVLATTTYNADIFPFMKTFLDHLLERNYQNRTVGLVENGSWAPVAAKKMTEALSGCKNITLAENTVTIVSALNDQSREELAALAAELWP